MIYELEEFLRKAVSGLESVQRWEPYVKAGATPENDLQHSLATSLLSIVVLELLREDPPGFPYDEYEILACATVHDLGEVDVGDTLYRYKSWKSDEAEEMSFVCQTQHLPPGIRNRLLALYLLQRSPLPLSVAVPPEQLTSKMGNALVFEFIERTGYILYAVGEYRRSAASLPLLVQVLRNQHARILELLTILPGGGHLFSDGFLDWAAGMIVNCQDVREEFPPPTKS